MSLLEEQIRILEEDLVAQPLRISASHDLPFAIFRYDPWDEYECREHARLLAHSLKGNHGKKVTFVSLARLLWKVVQETEGLESIIAEEKQFGFERAQVKVYNLLSDDDFLPLRKLLTEMTSTLNPDKDIVFLVRAAALAPGIYRCSTLLDEMHGRTMVPMVLFYPGTAEGRTDLRFMNLPDRANLGAYNYRVKIYGGH